MGYKKKSFVMSNAKKDPEFSMELLRLFFRGRSIAEVAEKTGLKRTTVARLFKRAQLRFFTPGKFIGWARIFMGWAGVYGPGAVINSALMIDPDRLLVCVKYCTSDIRPVSLRSARRKSSLRDAATSVYDMCRRRESCKTCPLKLADATPDIAAFVEVETNPLLDEIKQSLQRSAPLHKDRHPIDCLMLVLMKLSYHREYTEETINSHFIHALLSQALLLCDVDIETGEAGLTTTEVWGRREPSFMVVARIIYPDGSNEERQCVNALEDAILTLAKGILHEAPL